MKSSGGEGRANWRYKWPDVQFPNYTEPQTIWWKWGDNSTMFVSISPTSSPAAPNTQPSWCRSGSQKSCVCSLEEATWHLPLTWCKSVPCCLSQFYSEVIHRMATVVPGPARGRKSSNVTYKKNEFFYLSWQPPWPVGDLLSPAALHELQRWEDKTQQSLHLPQKLPQQM